MGILLLLFAFHASAAPAEIYSYRYAGKEIQAKVMEVEGLKMNDVCAAKPGKCAALQAYKGKSKFKSLKDAKQGNFVGAYCELLGGTQLFAARGKEEAIPFCVFKDLTFIDAGALYQEHAK